MEKQTSDLDIVNGDFSTDTDWNVLRKHPHLKVCFQTEIETKDGPLILFHHEPLTEADREVWKEFTRKEVQELLTEGLNFKVEPL